MVLITIYGSFRPVSTGAETLLQYLHNLQYLYVFLQNAEAVEISTFIGFFSALACIHLSHPMYTVIPPCVYSYPTPCIQLSHPLYFVVSRISEKYIPCRVEGRYPARNIPTRRRKGLNLTGNGAFAPQIITS